MPRKANRLTRQQDFSRVHSRGKSFFSPLFRLRYIANGLEQSRYAVAVGVKVSKKATVRNRLRRRVAEILRLQVDQIKPGFDIVVSPKIATLDCDGKELEQAVTQALVKAKLR